MRSWIWRLVLKIHRSRAGAKQWVTPQTGAGAFTNTGELCARARDAASPQFMQLYPSVSTLWLVKCLLRDLCLSLCYTSLSLSLCLSFFASSGALALALMHTYREHSVGTFPTCPLSSFVEAPGMHGTSVGQAVASGPSRFYCLVPASAYICESRYRCIMMYMCMLYTYTIIHMLYNHSQRGTYVPVHVGVCMHA